MKKKLVLMGSLFATLMAVNNATAQSGYKLSNTFHIKSTGWWDYIAVNETTNKLYVSHGTQVNILDKTNGDSLGIIPNTEGVHGIAFINSLGKGYTSNGRSNNVTVFDLATNKVLTQIATGENPDAIFYEPYPKTIITCNGRSKNLSVINPLDNTVIATIPVEGKPETAVSDEAGKVFVNIEDKNEIVVIDITKHQVIAHWSLEPADGPTGLAIDITTKRLFAGCEKQLVVMNADNGKIITKLPIGDGCDGVAFDNTSKLIFTSNGSGTVTVIKENNATDFTVVDNVITKRGARTICVDEQSHKLYLPTAEFEPRPAGEKGRPKMIDGTFQVLVLTK